MTYEEFHLHCANGTLPPDASQLQHALYQDFRGDWDTAHSIAQSIPSKQGSAVHAYLHRKEGDLSNANYWYRRASRAAGSGPLKDEWEALAREVTG